MSHEYPVPDETAVPADPDGEPHPSPTPPPRPRRRPSGWWFVAGGALILLAVGTFAGLLFWTLNGFMESDGTVPADGQSHTVRLDDTDARLLWFDDSLADPDCTVTDADTGEALRLRDPFGSYSQSRGTDWSGAWEFTPSSDEVAVTCSGADGARVLVGPTPHIVGFVGGILLSIVLPMILGLTGVTILIVVAVLYVTGSPRRAA